MHSPEELTELAYQLLSGGRGAWSFGVQGAVAEIGLEEPGWTVLRGGARSVTAIGPRGGLRLDLPDGAAVVEGGDGTLLFTVPAAALTEPPAVLAVEAGDPGALRPADRDSWLADLGLGRAACRFCVRTGDPALARELSAAAGLGWDAALDRVGQRLVADSPHRVVVTGAGRAEVYSPIPGPGGVSPPGPHTHLLPERLRRHEDLPPGLSLPPGRALGAMYHPPV